VEYPDQPRGGEIARERRGRLLVRHHDRERPLEIGRKGGQQDRGDRARAARDDRPLAAAEAFQKVRVGGETSDEIREHGDYFVCRADGEPGRD